MPMTSASGSGEGEGRAKQPRLGALEIDLLVERYQREMARYEDAARLVEDRLRRATRANAIKVLLSARAKHPEDLRRKLQDRARRGDARYEFQALDRALDQVVTDLAGCRVMAYRLSDVPNIVRIVLENFELASPNDAYEEHNKDSGYRATHVLIGLDRSEERLSLRGTTIEVQVTSLASHIFNELEHDIRYKHRNVPPSDSENDALHELLRAARLVDPSVERLMFTRASSVRRQTVELQDAEELKYTFEGEAGRPLHGEFNRLFRLLSAVVAPLTPGALLAFGSVSDLLATGAETARRLGLGEADDVVHISLALFEEYPDEFAALVREQRGPSTPLKRAVLEAAEAKEA